jgi:hypothetical protein
MIKKKISIIIFFLSAFLFCINLQSLLIDNLKITFFWLTIVVMACSILYQIFTLKKNRYIIFEIIIFYLCFHLVYQIGYYGLRGNDSYFDYNLLKIIFNEHQFEFGTGHISGWPLLHVFSADLSFLTNINPLIIAKFLPSFISSIIVISLYLLITNIYENQKVALFACFLFGSIPQFISFEAVFVREVFGIYFFVLFIFILYTSKHRNDFRLRALSLFLIPVILLSHHFSSFMLIIFLTIYIIASAVVPYLYRKRIDIGFKKININIFYVLLFASILSYWLFITFFIFNDFFSIFYEAIGIKEFVSYIEKGDLGTTIISLRGNILYYGFFLFNGIICIILFLKLFLRKNQKYIEDFSFTMFFYFCLFLGFLSLFVLGSLIYPDRFIPFALIFGLIPLSVLLFSLRKNVLKRILFVFLISFFIFNIYNIDTGQYTGVANYFGGIATEKEYAIAETIPIPNSYYGYTGVSGAIHDIQGIRPSKAAGKNPVFIDNFLNSSNFAIIYKLMYLEYLENTKIKSPLLYDRFVNILSYENFNDINKISDLGDIFIISWR